MGFKYSRGEGPVSIITRYTEEDEISTARKILMGVSVSDEEISTQIEKGRKGRTMLGTHTTGNGDKLLIAEMSTEHLLNTIERIISDAVATLKEGRASASQSAYARRLYGLGETDERALASKTQSALDRASRYMAEAFYRAGDIMDSPTLRDKYVGIRLKLDIILERNGQMPTNFYTLHQPRIPETTGGTVLDFSPLEMLENSDEREDELPF